MDEAVNGRTVVACDGGVSDADQPGAGLGNVPFGRSIHRGHFISHQFLQIFHRVHAGQKVRAYKVWGVMSIEPKAVLRRGEVIKSCCRGQQQSHVSSEILGDDSDPPCESLEM